MDKIVEFPIPPESRGEAKQYLVLDILCLACGKGTKCPLDRTDARAGLKCKGCGLGLTMSNSYVRSIEARPERRSRPRAKPAA